MDLKEIIDGILVRNPFDTDTTSTDGVVWRIMIVPHKTVCSVEVFRDFESIDFNTTPRSTRLILEKIEEVENRIYRNELGLPPSTKYKKGDKVRILPYSNKYITQYYLSNIGRGFISLSNNKNEESHIKISSNDPLDDYKSLVNLLRSRIVTDDLFTCFLSIEKSIVEHCLGNYDGICKAVQEVHEVIYNLPSFISRMKHKFRPSTSPLILFNETNPVYLQLKGECLSLSEYKTLKDSANGKLTI